jgi:steroid 5-alpha reductase family enzyme
VLWRVAVRIGDVSFIDAVWAYGMVVLGWMAFFWRGDTLGLHGAVISLLTSLWGFRLGTHLLLRWNRNGKDPRYEKILGGAMARNNWSFSTASLLIVFLLQGPLLFIVALPAQVGILSDLGTNSLGPLAQAGVMAAITGILFETMGDWQLDQFRKDPANKGKVMDQGLWRYTRHPNYFGDALTWWGIWMVASETGYGLWTVVCPLLLTWMLTSWSGKPILEKALGKTRPGYADYVARTSSFFPWPPKKP